MTRFSSRWMSIGLMLLTVVLLTGCTKASGGGWLLSATGKGKATFGFNGKCRDTTVDGAPVARIFAQIEYKDAPAGVRLHGTVDGTSFPDETCAEVQAENDDPGVSNFIGSYRPQPEGEEGMFILSVTDNGEPGVQGDEFHIQLTSGAYAGYTNRGLIGGGNIQVR